MSSNVTHQREEIELIFGRALPWIESALVQQYGLPVQDTTEIERCLYEWFLLFARRPGSPRSDDGLRPHLFLMACHAGHVWWAGKLAEKPPTDENVKRSLSLGPQQIAIELEKGINQRSESGPDDGGGSRRDDS